MTNGVTEPTVDDVAALLRARTQDNNDQEVGTFNDDTRPTGDEAQRMIDVSAGLIFGAVGDLSDLDCGDADLVRNSAQNLWILLAAMLIELSYFPEQVRDNRSPYDQFKELFDVLVPYVTAAVQACQSGDEIPTPLPGDSGALSPADAAWSFMQDRGGLVGWMTRW
jgi:hypothetical protein